jgi:hypothetical protein
MDQVHRYVFWIYFSEEKWPGDITCSPYCSAARSIRRSTAACLHACARGGRTGLRARSAMHAARAPGACRAPADRPRAASEATHGHSQAREAEREPPSGLLRAGDLRRQGKPERARPAMTTAPVERPASRVRGAHDATVVKETGASGLACSTAARHRTARGGRCRRDGLRRSRVSFFVRGGRRSRERSAIRGRSRDPGCVSRRVYWTYGDKTNKLKRVN